MATLYITEYQQVANVGLSYGPAQTSGQAPQEIAVANQQVAITGSSTASATFNGKTTFVRLHCDAICSIAFGVSPTANTSFQRMAANQTEYFGVQGGIQVAVISNV